MKRHNRYASKLLAAFLLFAILATGAMPPDALPAVPGAETVHAAAKQAKTTASVCGGKTLQLCIKGTKVIIKQKSCNKSAANTNKNGTDKAPTQNSGMGQNQNSSMGQNQNSGMGQNQNSGMGQNQNSGMGQNQNSGMGQNQNSGKGQNQNSGNGQNQDSGKGSTTPATSKETLDEGQIYSSMIALKEKYPEGTPWTNANYYKWNGGIFTGGYGCAGFAFMLSDAAFGTLPARKHTDFSSIRVGDILRVNNNSHSVIVLQRNADSVTVAEGNYNSSVHWGRKISLSSIRQTGTYVLTRYPQ